MLPAWFGISISFIYGIVVGSFLNVCIYRLPEDKSIISPPSHCPKCNTRLKGLDLVPLFSFLLLGRKCRYCHVPISWRYFGVELATGITFILTYLRFGFSIDYVVYILFISALIVAFLVDWDHFIIPDQVPIFGVALGLAKDIAHLIARDDVVMHIPLPWTSISIPMLPSIAGIVVCGGIFYFIAYVSFYIFKPKDAEALEQYEGAMGGGDVKLAGAMGAVLGIVPSLVSFLIAVLLGTVVGVTMLSLKARAEKTGVAWRTEIPFGPYMVTGAAVVIWLYPQLGALWIAWVNLIAP